MDTPVKAFAYFPADSIEKLLSHFPHEAFEPVEGVLASGSLRLDWRVVHTDATRMELEMAVQGGRRFTVTTESTHEKSEAVARLVQTDIRALLERDAKLILEKIVVGMVNEKGATHTADWIQRIHTEEHRETRRLVGKSRSGRKEKWPTAMLKRELTNAVFTVAQVTWPQLARQINKGRTGPPLTGDALRMVSKRQLGISVAQLRQIRKRTQSKRDFVRQIVGIKEDIAGQTNNSRRIKRSA